LPALCRVLLSCCKGCTLRYSVTVVVSDKKFILKICHALGDRRRGIGLTIGFIAYNRTLKYNTA
jgi:hypothetical protein